MPAGRDGISETEVRAELGLILSSKVFARSERMKRFLTYTVEESLLPGGSSVKEYAIALAVYDKPETFDPRMDPIVRVEASRLRAKLREYYDDEGQNDFVVISIRKRGYSAVYKKRRPSFVSDAALTVAREALATPEENAEAQDFYLKGLYHWNKRSAEAIAKAIECFKRAIALDSRYALAYAGLADCYASQAWLEVNPPSSLWLAAEAAAVKSLEIDGSVAQAITTLACKQALYDWNWTAAEASFRDAFGHSSR